MPLGSQRRMGQAHRRHIHRGGATVKHFAGLDGSWEETAIRLVDESNCLVKDARSDSLLESLDPAQRRGLEGMRHVI